MFVWPREIPVAHRLRRRSSSTPRFDYIHKKQSGGAGQYGRVSGRIEPLEGEVRCGARAGRVPFMGRRADQIFCPPFYSFSTPAIGLRMRAKSSFRTRRSARTFPRTLSPPLRRCASAWLSESSVVSLHLYSFACLVEGGGVVSPHSYATSCPPPPPPYPLHRAFARRAKRAR